MMIEEGRLKKRWGSDRRDGVVVRASASQSVDLGFIFPSRVIPI